MRSAQRPLWEVLIPLASNAGEKYEESYHRVWRDYVLPRSGGLTIFPEVQGEWYNAQGKLFREAMQPVRFLSSREDLEKVIDFTLGHYQQEAVMAYKVSDEVILKER